MSRLSNSRVRLTLAPAGLRATLSAGWPRRRELARARQRWEAPADLPQALSTLMDELAQTAPTRGATLDIEIANACMHFDVAEGVFAGHSDTQLGAVAAACVHELLGDTGGHEVRWQLQADERHLLICAIRKAIVEPLQQAAGELGLRLRCIVPALGAGWSQHADALDQGLGVLAFGDGEQALVAFVRDGVIEAVSTGTRPAGLEAQVARLVASLGLDLDRIEHFVAVLDGDAQPELSSRWMIQRDCEGQP